MAVALPKSLLTGLVSQVDLGTRGKSLDVPYDHVNKQYCVLTGSSGKAREAFAPTSMLGVDVGAVGNYWRTPDITWDFSGGIAQGLTVAGCSSNDNADNGDFARMQQRSDGNISINVRTLYFNGSTARGDSFNGTEGGGVQTNPSRLINDVTQNVVYAINSSSQRVVQGVLDGPTLYSNTGSLALTDGDYSLMDHFQIGAFDGRVFWGAFWNRMLSDYEQDAIAAYTGNPFLELHERYQRRPALYAIPGTLPAEDQEEQVEAYLWHVIKQLRQYDDILVR